MEGEGGEAGSASSSSSDGEEETAGLQSYFSYVDQLRGKDLAGSEVRQIMENIAESERERKEFIWKKVLLQATRATADPAVPADVKAIFERQVERYSKLLHDVAEARMRDAQLPSQVRPVQEGEGS
ncbi:hypothetical protein GUITHDRAFT_103480 [Guillardia theta CCMP2712]|uniref:Uncharacterized protein n=2 Tax=Guillardia theta TaxID=55529 RepID=L1JQQ7_GUITC|nr:hypothetical protein GUITHDRAFT_103480 [Guillardia theta CCMP2712]EKX50896.1 hypothetical protein GUITHDRAFT_103480 [Guillardia theta CCMP2712]|eukprot:XP_005837876.1 hypothetical protein GUITHDRAFT_103480 [Guillardia theta CCMP2712]